MDLYNKLSKKDRIKLIEKAGEKRFTLSFYKYELIKNLEIFRNFLACLIFVHDLSPKLKSCLIVSKNF